MVWESPKGRMMSDSNEESQGQPSQDFASLFSGFLEPDDTPVADDKKEDAAEADDSKNHDTNTSSESKQPEDAPDAQDKTQKAAEASVSEQTVANVAETAQPVQNAPKIPIPPKPKTPPASDTAPASKPAPASETHKETKPEVSPPKPPEGSGKKKVLLIAGVAAIIIIGSIIACIMVYNTAVDNLNTILRKERSLVTEYPDCTEISNISKMLSGELPSEVYVVENNSYSPKSWSSSVFERRLEALNQTEQACKEALIKAQAEKKAAEERALAEKKAAEERERAEQERIRAEQERIRAEQEQIRLEAARQAAEAERARLAEIEAQQAQEEAENQDMGTDSPAAKEYILRPDVPALRPVRTIVWNNKVGCLVFEDNHRRPCAVIANSKYELLQRTRLCIPFSGNDADVKDSWAGSKVAAKYTDHKKCKNQSVTTSDTYCRNFFNEIIQEAANDHWVSFSAICKQQAATDPVIREYCGYLY